MIILGKRLISYDTVIQSCVSQNKRRQSSKRYRGVANIKYQKPRKGFYPRLTLTLNGVTHSTNPGKLQKNGQHTLYDSPKLTGWSSWILLFDFTFMHPHRLSKQAPSTNSTSYNLSLSSTTSEVCCGIVKVSEVQNKDHLNMLQT